MFDLAWSEILLIAVVALVVVGPKDLPGAIRGIADTVKKARRGLAAMQQQADELVREAKLDDVRNQIAEVKSAFNEIRSFDLKGQVERAVDSDGTLNSSFSEGAAATPAWTPPPTARETPEAPAMIPPQTMAPYKPPPAEPQPAAPAFVPPTTPAPAVEAIATPSAVVMPPALDRAPELVVPELVGPELVAPEPGAVAPAKQPETRPA